MKITKIGHCCLIIEEQGTTIMTDPGAWSTAQNKVKGVDIVLITHEHPDHFHLESLKTVLANNPQATVITNNRVGQLCAESNISSALLEDSQQKKLGNTEIAAFGKEHATIYPAIPNVMNTGYLIANRFFYPGDAFTVPEVPIEIAAMPMIGPWMKLSEAIDWVKEIHPKICFPVHDGMLQPREWIYRTPVQVFAETDIQFDAIEPGASREY